MSDGFTMLDLILLPFLHPEAQGFMLRLDPSSEPKERELTGIIPLTK